MDRLSSALPLFLLFGCDVQAKRDAGPTAVLAAVSAEPTKAEKAARREARRDQAAKGKTKGRGKGKAQPSAPTPMPPPSAAPKPIAPAPGGPALPACPPDNPLTYRSFGAGFLRTWCTGCHSGSLAAKDRQDAPDDVDFEDAASYRIHAPSVYDRAVLEGRKLETDPGSASPMPPAGLVPAAELRRLEQWIACGSPGA